MIIDVKILAAVLIFPPPWRPVVSLSQAPKAKFHRGQNVHWIMFCRFATPNNVDMFTLWTR